MWLKVGNMDHKTTGIWPDRRIGIVGSTAKLWEHTSVKPWISMDLGDGSQISAVCSPVEVVPP